MRNLIMISSVACLLFISSCTVVRQGNVGVKQKLGKFVGKPIGPGTVAYNPFITRVIVLPTQLINKEVKLDLPSKEGLNVSCEISIIHKMVASKAQDVIQNMGLNYEQDIIVPVFRSASADVCSRFYAKDMHSAQRAVIEKDIKELMNKTLETQGIIIESVLMKSIKLPGGLADAIEQKLQAEQKAQQMEFELQRETLEAKRKLIEAEGTRDAQQVLSQGINDNIIKWQTIEAFKQLSNSPNSKIIITDGKSPMLLQGVEK